MKNTQYIFGSITVLIIILLVALFGYLSNQQNINKNRIPNKALNNKSDIIQELLDYLVDFNYLKRSVKLFSFIDSQESENSSAIGRGVAFPHSISKELEDLVCILGISKSGVHYDNEVIHPCHIILLSLSPENNPDIHRKFISKFRLLMIDPKLKHNIINAQSSEGIETILTNWEIEQLEEEL